MSIHDKRDARSSEANDKIKCCSGIGSNHFVPAALMTVAGLVISFVITSIPPAAYASASDNLVAVAYSAADETITDNETESEQALTVTTEIIPADETAELQTTAVYVPETTTENTEWYADEEQRKTDYENRKNESIPEQKKAAAEASAQIESTGYVRLNSSGIPMSEMEVPSYVQLDANGIPTSYIGIIEGKATAYYSGTTTSTGTRVRQGSVAVDPREIPYGTEMWITSADGQYVYGYCRAEDTGGFIYMENGATVDLYMHSYDDCINWGRRGVKIYILS